MIKIINSFFSNNGESNNLKLRFSKRENNWRITKGHEIVYMGDEAHCRSYMQNMQVSS